MKYKELFNYTNTWIFIFIVMGSLVDIFIVKNYIDVIELLLVIGWLYMLKISSATKTFTTPVVLFYVILIPVCLMFNNALSAQKLAIWVFYIFSGTILMKASSALNFK